MAAITTEGHMATTTTVIDNKNGSVLTPPVKVGKKSVTEDLITTFSSPAAWLLVVALIVTWSAVAIIMFDLVDYKSFAGSSVNKLSKDPLGIMRQTMEESADWLYGFISLLSDIISTDDDDSDEGEVEPPLKKKAEIHPVTKKKEIHKDKPDRQEKLEKQAPKVTHKDKPEKQDKTERKEQPKVLVVQKTKPEKQEKAEKAPPKVIQKEKPEREEKVEKKTPPKEEKKVKSTKIEEQVKKEVKDGKTELKAVEKSKQTEAKVEEVGLIKAKPKVKEEKAVKTETKSEKKDQYAFCRYVIDMFAHRDFYTGQKETEPPHLLVQEHPRKKPAAPAVEEIDAEKRATQEKSTIPETKKKEKEEEKKKSLEKTEIKKAEPVKEEPSLPTLKKEEPVKAPAAKPATLKVAAPVSKSPPAPKTAEESPKKEKLVETGKPLKKEIPVAALKVPVSVESRKVKETQRAKEEVVVVSTRKAVLEKKEEKSVKAVEQDKPKPKETNPIKEKEVKPSVATKDKEHVKEKEVKHTSALKDKDHVKEKTVKTTEVPKDKENAKEKTVKTPGERKDKENPKEKTVKTPEVPKDKEHTKEKAVKTPEVPKDKEVIKRKEEKSPATLKEKDSTKEKEVKPPVLVKEIGATRKQAVKPPVVVKEKEPEVKKEEKQAKPAPVKSEGEKKEPAVKKEEKREKPVILEAKKVKDTKVVLHPTAEGKKVEAKLPTTVVKPHAHKHQSTKQEKAISYTKPEEKIKQEKAVATEKTVKSQPAKHETVKHGKEVPQTKSAKPKITTKPASEITVAAKKKTEKVAKEREEKTEKKHPKEGKKAKAVTTVKEILRQHNLTTEKISKAAKTPKEYAEIISIKKEKAPVRYFQCVFLDGNNGYGLQFPITSTPSQEKSTSQTKTSGRKSKSPGH
ncbi:triadin isoform X6 [Carettochelys insculpta]|uniref:triadin isoform X6 n=1 Tax=Carettochelys insculpta TaxID=44489 RepID=UPI003EBCB034